jgi:hypothetical protein
VPWLLRGGVDHVSTPLISDGVVWLTMHGSRTGPRYRSGAAAPRPCAGGAGSTGRYQEKETRGREESVVAGKGVGEGVARLGFL